MRLNVESAADAPAHDRVLVGHGGLFGLMLPLVLASVSRDFARAHGLPHSRPIVAEARPDGLVCGLGRLAGDNLSDRAES